MYEVVRRAARGESKRGIARALGIAPRTVKKILVREEVRRGEGESALDRELPRRRTPRASKLDGFEDKITAWLEQYPDLTATRLLEKLAGEGFTGGYTIVREHLQAWRASHAPPPRAVQRVETAPGHQGQFDWSPFELESGEIENVWSYTLSWSRGRSFAADDNQRQTTILRRLHDSFAELGGVPHESVTDTMAGVVDGWECNQPILNIRFVDFAAYYRFAVHVSPRRYPPYKGKVERPFRYVDENFCNGRTFASREAFREGLEVFDRGVHAIAELERIPDGAGQIAQSDRKRRGRYDVTLLQARFAAWGPAAEDFATKLRRHKRTPGPELDHILKLQVGWSVNDIVAAIEHAAKYDAFHARAVERILEARFRPRRLAEQIADATRNQIRDAMRGHPIEQRALSSYETLRLGDRVLREPREEDARDQADDETDPG